MSNEQERDYLGKALDIAIRLVVVGMILLLAFRIFSPFVHVMVWASVIAIALFPVYEKLRSLVGGKAKVAGGIFIAISLACVLVPTFFLADSLLDSTVRLVKSAEAGDLQLPPPTEKVKTWPLIGDRAYQAWSDASADLRGTTDKMQPQLRQFGQKIVATVSGLGKDVVKTVLALVIAGILMMTSGGARSVAESIAKRLAGDDGPGIVDLTIGTVRSVVKGVILVAMIQGLLAAVGLAVAGVPGVGLWALLVLVVAVIQLPPILILGPIIPWVFAHNDSTAIAVFFAIWSIIVSGSDGVLKPMLLGRGVKVPMLVILVGAIGGMLRGGVIGLFIGPVVLAIAYELFMAWVREDTGPAESASSVS